MTQYGKKSNDFRAAVRIIYRGYCKNDALCKPNIRPFGMRASVHAVVYSSCAHFLSNFSSSPLDAWTMQDPGLLRDQFPDVSIPSYFSPASNTHFHHRTTIFCLAFQRNFFLPSGIILNTSFTVISCGILSTCPNHRNLPSLISEIICGYPYSSINS